MKIKEIIEGVFDGIKGSRKYADATTVSQKYDRYKKKIQSLTSIQGGLLQAVFDKYPNDAIHDNEVNFREKGWSSFHKIIFRTKSQYLKDFWININNLGVRTGSQAEKEIDNILLDLHSYDKKLFQLEQKLFLMRTGTHMGEGMELHKLIESRTRKELLKNIADLADKIFGEIHVGRRGGHEVHISPDRSHILQLSLMPDVHKGQVRKFIRALKQKGYPIHGNYKLGPYLTSTPEEDPNFNQTNSLLKLEILIDDPSIFML